jgi:tryptophan halogenase
MTTSIRNVVVVGGDASAWLAAAAVKKAFMHRAVNVLVVEPEQLDTALPGWWTLPSLRGLHSMIGIRESDFLRRTGATFRLGTEHLHWQGNGSRYLHAHGDIGTSLSGTQFYKYLLMQALAGRPEKIADYSLAATAAQMGRFARPMSTNALTSSFTYGFHIDASKYIELLREHAIKLGVSSVRGDVTEIERRENGQISCVISQQGERIPGDLFLDCSGRRGVLMNRVSDEPREDWSAWLINDRILSATAPAANDPPALTRTIAGTAGWSWQIPLAGSSVVGHAYCSAFARDHEIAEHLRPATAGNAPSLVSLSQGRRRSNWVSNCIAIGDAAVELEPLAGTALHVAELGIAMLIELFPLEPASPLEAIEYNRIIGEHADALRDFAIAHYRAGEARADEYWLATRAQTPPERFANRMDLYRAGGRLQMLDNESFEETDWAWLLLGANCLPEALELHVRAHLSGATPQAFESLRSSIQRLAASMPKHIDYLRHQH